MAGADSRRDRQARPDRWARGAIVYPQSASLGHVARQQGGDTDTTRDHEYTDWEDLTRFVEEFVVVARLKPSGR